MEEWQFVLLAPIAFALVLGLFIRQEHHNSDLAGKLPIVAAFSLSAACLGVICGLPGEVVNSKGSGVWMISMSLISLIIVNVTAFWPRRCARVPHV